MSSSSSSNLEALLLEAKTTFFSSPLTIFSNVFVYWLISLKCSCLSLALGIISLKDLREFSADSHRVLRVSSGLPCNTADSSEEISFATCSRSKEKLEGTNGD